MSHHCRLLGESLNIFVRGRSTEKQLAGFKGFRQLLIPEQRLLLSQTQVYIPNCICDGHVFRIQLMDFQVLPRPDLPCYTHKRACLMQSLFVSCP